MALKLGKIALLTLFALSAIIPSAPQTHSSALSASQLSLWGTTKKHLETLAESGDANAQYELGLMYEFQQDGNSPDRTGAAYWYKQSADHGNIRSMYRLGIYYYDQGNDNTAYKYFEQAANRGMPAAMFRFGDMLVRTNLHGNGQYYGLSWLEKAADAGDPDAANELGRRAWQLYLHPGPAESKYSAAEWFAKAAAAGSCEGAMNLGGVYFNGVGVTQEASKADFAFRSAESCPGAPSWVIEKSTAYRRLIAQHKLPDPSLSKPDPVIPPARVDSHENQMAILIAGVVAVVGVAALLGSSQPRKEGSSNDNWLDDYNADMWKRSNDLAQGLSHCSNGNSFAAATLGVWCP